MSKFNWSNPPYKIKKDGTQSKVHDRSVYRTPGNEVELAYGTFTVLKAEKIDKVWYVILTDNNATFKIKQQQMGNKKLPKTRVIIADTQPVIAGLLPAPKELIDQILEQANIFVTNFKQQQLANPNNFTKNGQLKKNVKIKKTWQEFKLAANEHWLQDPVNLFEHKAHFIDISCRLGWKQSKKVYRQLLQYYHPDHNSNYPTQYLEKLNWLNH